ncbi:glucuronate isomerase [Microbacterium aurantiacum]|uniref:glucuronate isomerase n=1 Tax=Microbacterium aurantiacum TaxID=162393 RepID=UPI003F498A1F
MPASTDRDPARLLPVDPTVRAIASDLYARVADRPIISPHGHVPPSLLLDDEAYADPVALLMTGDHYVTRLLHAAGVDLADLVVDQSAGRDARAVWRTLAERWHLFAGTASGYWIEEELDGVFGITTPLGHDSADEIFDDIATALARPEFRPRALFRRFGIEFLATTDDPLDDLAEHAALAASDLTGRVVPTFRPDRYLDPDVLAFATNVERLLAATGRPADFAGYLDALQDRRAHFIAHGAVSTDHGVEEMLTLDLDPVAAESLFRDVLSGVADAAQRRAFRAHMLVQMARMSVEDGLVMTIHPGVRRNHSSATLARFGPDTGHDIPVATEFTRGIRPLLEKYGLERDFHLVLFAVDETTYSRELAPLAGFYPSVYLGAPWWFLDAPDAIARHRAAVTETAGFYRSSGFIDDTRAFLSIPARHDTSRRVDAGFLARLVVEGRVRLDAAERIIDDLVDAIPRKVFKL